MTSPKTEIVTPEFRISFPSLFRPDAQEGQEPKYKLTMLYPKAAEGALAPLKQRARELVAAKWPNPKTRPATIRNPFRDGEEKAHLGGYSGTVFCTATNKSRPKVLGPDMQPILDESRVYAGSYGRAVVKVYAYCRNGNSGVGLSLIMVQWLRDGEPFGHAYGTPEEYFGGPELAAGGMPAKAPEEDFF